MRMSLVSELRNYTYWCGSSQPYSRDIHPPICDEAADYIEALENALNIISDQLESGAFHDDYVEKALEEIGW